MFTRSAEEDVVFRFSVISKLVVTSQASVRERAIVEDVHMLRFQALVVIKRRGKPCVLFCID